MKVECEVLKPMYHAGKAVEVGAVISLPKADAQYLVGIGRVALVAAEEPNDAKAKPAGKAKKAD